MSPASIASCGSPSHHPQYTTTSKPSPMRHLMTLILIIAVIFAAIPVAFAQNAEWDVSAVDVPSPSTATRFTVAPRFFKVTITMTATGAQLTKIQVDTLGISHNQYHSPEVEAFLATTSLDRITALPVADSFAPPVPDIDKFVLSYITDVRLPLDITVSLSTGSPVNWQFPGISPVTRTIFPAIEFIPMANINEWKTSVIALHEEFHHPLPPGRDYHLHDAHSLSIKADGANFSHNSGIKTFYFSTSSSWDADLLTTPAQRFELIRNVVGFSYNNPDLGHLEVTYTSLPTPVSGQYTLDVVPVVLFRHYTRPLRQGCRATYDDNSNQQVTLSSVHEKPITSFQCTYEMSSLAYDYLVGPDSSKADKIGRFPLVITFRPPSATPIYYYVNPIPHINFRTIMGSPVPPPSFQWDSPSMDQVIVNGKNCLKSYGRVILSGFIVPHVLRFRFINSGVADRFLITDNIESSGHDVRITDANLPFFTLTIQYCRQYTYMSPASSLYVPSDTQQFMSSSSDFSIKLTPIDVNMIIKDFNSQEYFRQDVKPPLFQPRPVITINNNKIGTNFPLALSSWAQSFEIKAKIPSYTTANPMNIWNDARTTFPSTNSGFFITPSVTTRVGSNEAGVAQGNPHAFFLSPKSNSQSSMSAHFSFLLPIDSSVKVMEVEHRTEVFDGRASYDETVTKVLYFIHNLSTPSKRYIGIKSPFHSQFTYDMNSLTVPDETLFTVLRAAEGLQLSLCMETTDSGYSKPWTAHMFTSLFTSNYPIPSGLTLDQLCQGSYMGFDANLPSLAPDTTFYFGLTTSGETYYSSAFKYNPIPDISKFNFGASEIDAKQRFGPDIKIIDPQNVLTFELELDKVPLKKSFVTANNVLLTLNMPKWIKMKVDDIYQCRLLKVSDGNTYGTAPTVPMSALPRPNSDIIETTLGVTFGFPTAFTPGSFLIKCTIPISLDTTITPSYPRDLITPSIRYTLRSSLENDDIEYSPTLTKNFLHPTGADSCDGKTYQQCIIDETPITNVSPVVPPVTPKLPSVISSLEGCDAVKNNYGIVEKYQDFHAKMCSIPISGILTKRAITSSTYPELGFSDTKPQYSLCDCRCKGYWVDDVMNNDGKKCSKCAVPNCPALFTSNNECTACECSTPQCKRFTTNVFGMLYIKPQVLRYIIKTNTNPDEVYSDSALEQDELLSTLHAPITSAKLAYQDIMNGFATYLKDVIQKLSVPTTHTSTITNVLISPLVEGSFTVWKITIVFVNGAQKQLSELAPLYGLPGLNESLGSLFGKYFVHNRLFLTHTGAISPSLINHISTSPFHTVTGTTLPLFPSDVIKTGCATYDDVQKSLSTATTPVPITASMLLACPLPNQYINVKGNVTKSDSFNPLWSKCEDATPISFNVYDRLLTDGTKTSLRVRQIYPYCFDFTGVNVGAGTEHNIPCGYPNPSMDYLYNSQTSSLILPSYATALLNSFVPPASIPAPALARLDYLRNLQQSRFPSFPFTTVAPCPVIHNDNTSSEPIKCQFGEYGNECENTYIISPTSMTSSPTHIEPESHTHVQWDFMGDNAQELTIVLYSTQKKNDGQGYFVWSQILTTVPVASLYASAQVPTLDQSKLFEMVYSAIASGKNSDLIETYNASTKIAIKGYFTHGAQHSITLDTSQIIEEFTFELPMLCTEFKVSCKHSSQYCTQNDGRCKCKTGYYDANPTQERSPNYTIDPTDATKNIDGGDLTCLPLCQNDGEWDDETSQCQCQDGYNGEYCQIKDNCQVNKSTLCQADNGYIAFTIDSETTDTTPSCQDTTCECYGKWIDQLDAPDTEALITKKPRNYTPRKDGCSICALKPINAEFYSPEQLNAISDYYSSSPDLTSQCSLDEMYTQTYQPIPKNVEIDEELHPLTQQRCYITGTQPSTYEDGNCIKCKCKRGYGGDYCQLHIAYANMTYTPAEGNNYIYDKTTEVLLFDKITEELSLSMNNFDQTQMFVIQHNRDYHWVEIGLYTGLDFFTRNGAAIVAAQHQYSVLNVLATTTTTTIPTDFDPTLLPINLDSLYTQWDDLTTNFPSTPVKNQDSNQFLGEVNPPQPIQDPSCFEQEILGCSGVDERPKRANGNALLIGLVVGLVLAAALFILLVLLLLWCRKNERGFWKSQKEQDRAEMSSFVMTPRQDFKGSTAAPSVTVGTSSITPIIGSGIELQPMVMTKTSAIQSASNHTQVIDPSLPSHIKAYKDGKGQIFYVNDETMTTSWTHPNEVEKADGNGGAEDYGW